MKNNHRNIQNRSRTQQSRTRRPQRKRRNKLRPIFVAMICIALCAGIVIAIIAISNSSKNKSRDVVLETTTSVPETTASVITEQITESAASNGNNIIPADKYAELVVDECGWVPIMMYHDIVNMKNSETPHIGGNVDVDGYNRTSEAFINDLEYYYTNGYRFIRLEDYLNGEIYVEGGKSPIILTFDDGHVGNCRVTGRDENGEIIIDPNSAVGIMEAFKKKHPDANITATFFLNAGLFRQENYDVEIMQWLVNHGYDIGNHTRSHVNFTKATPEQAIDEVGYMYKKFDEIIPGQYVKILALPYGEPTKPDAEIRQYIDNIMYEGVNYVTEGVLACGWTAEYSCFDNELNKRMIKRCRAYDNNGEMFDIKQVFTVAMPSCRFISDGNPNTIVIPKKEEPYLNNEYGKEVIIY